MPLWHTEYFGLKLLERRLVQGHSNPPLSPWEQHSHVPCGGALPVPGGGRHPYHLRQGLQGQGGCRSKPCCFIIYYPKLTHLCLCTLHTFTVSLSNATKASHFNYLSLVFLWGSNIHKTKFVFLLLVCVMSMSLSGQPKNLEGKEGTRFGPCAC